MNFNTDVDRGFVDAILESSLWKKAQIEVAPREVVNESSEEGDFDIVPDMDNQGNRYQEPQELAYEEDAEVIEEDENISFNLDDLQVVLDNLAEDDLMEHALSMLEVFDVAYEQLTEDEEEYDEEALDEGKPAKGKPTKKHGEQPYNSNPGEGPGHGGGRRLRTGRASGLPKGTSRARRQDLASTQNIGKRS